MKYIMHIDGDAFFAACEISRRPDLKNRPVVVGEERGIACALTLEAKKLGVHRGMPIFQIRKEFPETVVLSSHFELYRKFYRNLLLLLHEKLSAIEPYSIDECFALIPENVEIGELENFIRSLKSEVQKSLGITFSFGVASTKTLAKLASKIGKPDGCCLLITSEKIKEALLATPIGSIWGIGRSLSASLIGRNILTAKDFTDLKAEFLEKNYSKPVIETWLELSSKRVHEVSMIHEDKKSIQSTRSLAKKTKDFNMLFSEISKNTEEACRNLRAAKLFTDHIYFYFKGDRLSCERLGGEVRLPSFTQDPGVILNAIEPLLRFNFKPGVFYKSTGITLSSLRVQDFIPEDLFSIQTKSLSQSSYNQVLDQLNERFGEFSLMRASSLGSIKVREAEKQKRDKSDNYEYGLPLIFMGETI